jgi:hypothetical protein
MPRAIRGQRSEKFLIKCAGLGWKAEYVLQKKSRALLDSGLIPCVVRRRMGLVWF